MEEKPPAQRRPRSPRTPFSTPEQPAPADEQTGRPQRRPAKAAPPVTFQPPAEKNIKPSSGTGTEPPPAAAAGRPQSTPRATAPAKRTRPAAAGAQSPTEVGELLIPQQPSTPAKKAAAKRAPRKAPARRAAAPARSEVTDQAGQPRSTDVAEPVTAVETVAPAEQPSPVVSTQPTLPTEPPPPTDKPSVDVPPTPPPADAAAVTSPPVDIPPAQPPTDVPQTKPSAVDVPPAEPAADIPEVKASDEGAQPAQLPADVPESKASAVDVRPAQPAAVPAVAAPAGVSAAGPRTDAWAKIVADPGHSPELLALAAVQTIGPRAKEWASRVSSAYPNASAAGKARLAGRQFTRFGSLSSLCAALAGSYAPVALLGTAALTQADLVLHIAAAHGFDPTDEQRAVELLVLTKVHPSREEAVAALGTAKQPAYEDEDGGFTDAVWRLGRMLATQAGGWAAIRVVNRVLPGTSLLTAVLTSRSSAQALAARAHRFYSQESQAFGRSV